MVRDMHLIPMKTHHHKLKKNKTTILNTIKNLQKHFILEQILHYSTNLEK